MFPDEIRALNTKHYVPIARGERGATKHKFDMGKIISIEFKGRYGDMMYYFGSKAAVFDTFTKDDIGISYKTLRGINLSVKPYENRVCIIRQGELQRKKSDRGCYVKSLHGNPQDIDLQGLE